MHITPEYLKKIIRYDSQTGLLFWLPRDCEMFTPGEKSAGWQSRAWNAKFAGKHALHSINDSGYRRGNINGVQVRAHRVAWALHYGEWPDGEVDHANGDRTDNRISNLRVCSSAQNKMNSRRKNKNGFRGIIRNGSGWCAIARKNGKVHYGGQFETKLEAAKAYDKIARELHGDFAVLNFP